MFGPHEAWLSLGAIAFYLVDSMALLYADQLLVERAAGRWRPRRGSSMLIAGRRPYLPNPLAPHRPLLAFSLERLLGDGKREDVKVQPVLDALAALRMLVLALLLLFAALPVVLYLGGTGAAFLGWMGIAYAVIVAMAVSVWRRRAVLGLSRTDAARIAFEGIACAPFAINIVRRVTKRLDSLDLAGARTLMDAESFRAFHETVDRMLEECMEEFAPSEPAVERLAAFRARLRAGVGQ